MNKNMSSFQKISEMKRKTSVKSVHIYVVHTTIETYLNIHILRTTIEIRRQTIEIQHPMYDITVKASASVACDVKYSTYVFTIICNSKNFYLLWFMFGRHQNSKTCKMVTVTYCGHIVRIFLHKFYTFP